MATNAKLAEFMKLTGCRLNEARALRQGDIDVDGPVWEIRPTGSKRVIYVGPRAQALLKTLFTFRKDAFLFPQEVQGGTRDHREAGLEAAQVLLGHAKVSKNVAKPIRTKRGST